MITIESTLIVGRVSQLTIVPVRHIHRSIRSVLDIDRTKPGVRRIDGITDIFCLESRTNLLHVAHHDVIENRRRTEQLPLVFGR